ncbi:fatty acid biosynthesis protein YqhY [Bacillus tequilensis]|uniref:Fatty acid biosynthesis protein YqhY n=1 Tax=Bacillus tequilensis TaxID=227866 RepID=A0A6H0WMS9_9BACI|nr:fatty acid biosynthesis protein YqhY [Bacillus tequilensis]MDR4435663.1 Asp23/Gls24 family envelope stress response protein [Bacillus tequilensis]QIW80603.1 fatty acid biosynthesis protein YqhY [Bacillus tequilensis]
MKDNSLLKMDQEDTHLGKVEIAPEVIEVISGIAASEVDGVAEMRGNFATGVVERFGKVNHGKGVKVDLADDGITIDVYCVVSFGVSIPKVAASVQENIRQTLLNMTSLAINEINIHIVGIQFDTKAQEVQIDEEM